MANFYGELVIRITSDTTGLKKGLNESAAATTAMGNTANKSGRLAAQRMEHVGRQMQNIGRQMTQFVTLPVVAGFGLAAIAGYKFEKSLQKIRNLTGTSQADTRAYGEALKKLAVDTGQSAFTLAEGFYYISSSGFKGADAMKVVTAAAKAAAIGMGDTKVTSDLLTSALNAYGMGAEKAAYVTDVLAKTIEVGKAEPEALATSLGRIMPVAQNLGVSLPELGGSVAGLTLTGLSAAEAVTALRGTMMALVAPAKMSIDEFKRYGLTVKEVQSKIKDDGLLATLQMLWDKTDGNRLSMRKMIPNVRALNGVLASLGPNYEKTKDAIAKVSDAQGALDKAFKRTQQDKVFKIEQAWERIKVVFIDIGQTILPTVAEALEWLGEKVQAAGDWFNGLSENWKSFLMKAAVTAAIIGPVVMVLGTLINALGLLRGAVVGLNIAATLSQIFGAGKFAFAASGGSRLAAMAAGMSTFAASLGPVAIGLGAIALAAAGIWAGNKLYNYLTGTTERMQKMARAAYVLESDTSGKLKKWVYDHFGKNLVVHDGLIVWKPQVKVDPPPQPKENGLVKWIKLEAQKARNAIREGNKMQRLEIATGAQAAAEQASRLYADKAKYAQTPRQREKFEGISQQAAQDAERWGYQIMQLTGQVLTLQEAGDKLEIFAGMQDRARTIDKQIAKVKELRAEVAKNPGDMELGFKLEKAERGLDRLRREMTDYTRKNWQIILEVRADRADAKLKAINKHLRWLGNQKPSPEIDAQIAAWERKRDRVKADIAALDAAIAAATVTVNDQATGPLSVIQGMLDRMPATKVVKVMVTGGGIVENAYGGYYKKPTLTMVGEAGPEVILPLTKPNRMAQLVEQAGISEMIAPRPVPPRAAPVQRQQIVSGGDVHHHYHSTVSIPGGTIVDQPQKLADRLSPYQAANMRTTQRRRQRGQVGR